jgi:hypothetical protein
MSLKPCIAEYKQTHAFIEAHHGSLKHTLSDEAQVSTRLARATFGIYHEPLERVLEYLGLSVDENQEVNTNIEGATGIVQVLVNQARNDAKCWYNLSKE